MHTVAQCTNIHESASINLVGKDRYHRQAGEVEARNVSARINITPEKRRATLLSETEDVAREDQIFLREGAEMAQNRSRYGFSKDKQGNPVNANGSLILEEVSSIGDITDNDFIEPSRNIMLPSLPNNVQDALGANGKRVIIKKNIFERNAIRHSDITPEQSRDILNAALYSPNLYGQNQKSKKPHNWVVISVKSDEDANKLVLLEVNNSREYIEVVHWHYVDNRGIEKIKRQAEREDGQLLILPPENSGEVGALSDPTLSMSSESKDTTSIPENLTNVGQYSLITPEMDASYLNAVERGDNPNVKGKRFVLAGGNYDNLIVDDSGVVTSSSISEAEGKSLVDVVGKDMAEKMMSLEDGDSISGDGLRIGGEGMRGFYDQMLPSFVKKYTKKWGAEVKDITMPALEENNTMHAVNVTDAMRESVMQGQPKFSLMEHAEYVKGLCDLARGVYSITSPIVVAATKEDYAKTIEKAGYSSESSETSFAVYLKNTDTIAVNAENIKEKHIFVQSITHENAHSITKNLLWEEIETVVNYIDKEDIDDLQKVALGGYEEYLPTEILDELISTFIQYFSTKQSGDVRLLDGYLKGYFLTDDLVNYMESVAINTYGKRFAPIIKALMPILRKNLEINKEKYERQEIGSRKTTIRFDRAKETQTGNESRIGTVGKDFSVNTSDPVYDSKAQAKEVDTQYSLHTAPMSEEEQIRIYLRQKHLKNKEDIRKKYRAYRSAARMHYKEERT